MGHILLHVVTSNVFFILNYECITLFLKKNTFIVFLVEKVFESPTQKNTLKKMKSKIASMGAIKIQ
jgi:hypothetical protein